MCTMSYNSDYAITTCIILCKCDDYLFDWKSFRTLVFNWDFHADKFIDRRKRRKELYPFHFIKTVSWIVTLVSKIKNSNMSLVKFSTTSSFPNACFDLEDHVYPGPWTVYGGCRKIKIKVFSGWNELNDLCTHFVKYMYKLYSILNIIVKKNSVYVQWLMVILFHYLNLLDITTSDAYFPFSRSDFVE